MSGHSKWSTIKRQKGAADVKKGQAFTKLANVITIAVKLGGSGNPDDNPRLQMAIETSRGVNMPKDNIQRAIDRGLGKGGALALEEVLYEGFGPGKVAFMVEGVSDNKMRTTAGIKNTFERSGGSMVGQGSVAYMFDRIGEIRVKLQESRVKSQDEEMLELIDLGAEDVEDSSAEEERGYLVYVQSPKLNTMSTKIIQAGYEVESSEIVYKPNTLVQITDKETAQKVLDFTEKLEDNEDVHKVYANFDIPENLINE